MSSAYDRHVDSLLEKGYSLSDIKSGRAEMEETEKKFEGVEESINEQRFDEPDLDMDGDFTTNLNKGSWCEHDKQEDYGLLNSYCDDRSVLYNIKCAKCGNQVQTYFA